MSILFMFLPLVLMLGMFGLFIWQAVWVALDSRKKGEEYWWLWTIAAIIAFPIGLIVYVIVSKSDKSNCNNCGKEVPKNLSVCPYCGQKCGFFCPNCGQKVECGWKYCPQCTGELPEEISIAKKKNTTNKIVFIVVGIIIAIILFFVLIAASSFMMFSSGSNVINEEVSVKNYDYDGYTGEGFLEKYSNVEEYTIPNNVHSFWYKGELDKGEVTIKLYDNNRNFISEAQVTDKGEFSECFVTGVESGNIIEIEFNNFQGEFYRRFN